MLFLSLSSLITLFLRDVYQSLSCYNLVFIPVFKAWSRSFISAVMSSCIQGRMLFGLWLSTSVIIRSSQFICIEIILVVLGILRCLHYFGWSHIWLRFLQFFFCYNHQETRRPVNQITLCAVLDVTHKTPTFPFRSISPEYITTRYSQSGRWRVAMKPCLRLKQKIQIRFKRQLSDVVTYSKDTVYILSYIILLLFRIFNRIPTSLNHTTCPSRLFQVSQP